MTRYFLFEYDDYYPCGGFNDLTGIFESEEDALASLKGENKWDKPEWFANVDVYSLGDGSDKPQLLYNKFLVLDGKDVQFVIGNEGKKLIKLVGKWRHPARGFLSSYTKMSDCKVEGEL